MNIDDFKTKLAAARSEAELDRLMIECWPDVYGSMEDLDALKSAVLARYEAVACRGCDGHSPNVHQEVTA